MGCESVRELVCAWQCSRCWGWKSEQDRHVTCPEGVHNPGLPPAHRRFLLGFFSIKPCSPSPLSPALWCLMAPTRFPKSLGKHRAKAMKGGGRFENAFEAQQPEEATCPCRPIQRLSPCSVSAGRWRVPSRWEDQGSSWQWEPGM